MNAASYWAAGCALTMLAACVGEHDHFYTLSSTTSAQGGSLSTPALPATLSVTIPSLVDRSEMVIQRGDHGIEVLDHRRWGEPLADQVSQTVARDLEQRRNDLLIGGRGFERSGAAPLRIRVDIVRMSARLGGQATLEAHWRVDNGAIDVIGGDFFTATVRGSDYEAVAVAYSDTLSQLADALTAILPR